MTAALLVIDVQQEYFTGALPIAHPDRDEVTGRIVDAMRAARAAGVPVVVVQHSEGDEAPVFRPGTPTFELHPAVAAEPSDHLIVKRYPGTFTGTDLGEWMAAHDVTELVVSGFMTHMCCDTTTRQAVHMDVPVTVLSDGTGTVDLKAADGTTVPARQVHETELAVLGDGLATISTTDAWIASLG